MDESQGTTIEFASSKDIPVQRTRITITSDKIISKTLSTDTTGTTTLTTTKTRTLTVSNATKSDSSGTFTSSLISATGQTPPPTDINAPPIAQSKSKSLPGGTVAGIVFGIMIALVIIGFFVWWLLRKRKRQEEQNEISHPVPNPGQSSFRLLSQPQLAELEHDSRPLPPPEPTHWFGPNTPDNSRLSSWTGTQFSTPRPAVAEVKSYTRAGQKPRVYDIGGNRISELPAENSAAHATSGSFEMVPMPQLGDESIVSPLSPSPQARPMLPWQYENDLPWTRRGR